MSIQQLLTRAAKQGVFLFADNGQLGFELSVDEFPTAIKAEILASKQEIIEFLSEAGEHEELLERPPVKQQATINTELPLSFAQKRLWFIDRLEEGSPEYNMPTALKCKGLFDVKAAEQAITQIIKRHHVLRTHFAENREGPVQIINEQFDFHLKQIDLTDLSPQQQQIELAELARQDRQKIFDLTGDIMIRASYLKLSDEDGVNQGVLLFNMHHIASDGWSMGVLIKEFVEQYQIAIKGEQTELCELPIQYADYAIWQQQWLAGEVLDNQLGYWKKQLAELPVVHSLPLDYPRPQTRQHQADVVYGELPAKISQGLQALARSHNITPFMLLHGAVALVLSRHSNSEDIVVGTPVANRMQAELEPLIGFFVNTLILRVDASHTDIGNYLKHVKQVNLDAQANQDVPFEQLVEQSKLSRTAQHTPLFQIMFSMNTNQPTDLSLQGLEFSPLVKDELVAKYDLEIDANITHAGVQLSWLYDRSIFSQPHINQLNNHLQTLLTDLERATTENISELGMLSLVEQERLLSNIHKHQKFTYDNSLIHQQFESMANQYGGRIAIEIADIKLTYAALNKRANQLAHLLKQRGVIEGDIVGLSIPRTETIFIAVLAVLKVGASYLPLDPQYPSSRLQYMIEDSGLTQLLTCADITEQLALPKEVNQINLIDENCLQELSSYPTTNLEASSLQKASTTAYIIYTSGSTGKPKGVMISHSNWASYVESASQLYGIKKDDRLLQFSSISFDIFIEEISCSLLNGATIVMPETSQVPDCQSFWRQINRQNISVVSVPTAYWHLMSNDPELAKNTLNTQLRLLITGGEAMSPAHLQIWQNAIAQPIQLLNTYGPTETTVVASCFDVTDFQWKDGAIPIGQPLSNTAVAVLNSNHQLTPQGCVGELYISGDAVASGYLNNPQLTAQRFLDISLANEPNRRFYQTGDLVRVLADDNLQFIGRADDQVKFRGFRIEPGEIEKCLLATELVASCVVMVRQDANQEKRLVGYVVGRQALVNHGELTDRLIQNLKQQLPEYMVPSAIVILQELPVTQGGKIDKKALPAPTGVVNGSQYVAAETDSEKTLVSILAELIGIEPDEISVTSDFFELGGHSLLAVRLVAEIRHRINLELPIKSIFSSHDIRGLAAELESQDCQQSRIRISPRADHIEQIPLSFAQQRLWFIDQLEGGSVHYNMPAAIQIGGDFEAELIQQALLQIVNRHQILRTTYRADGDSAVQIIQRISDFPLAVFDLTDLEPAAQRVEVKRLAMADACKPFDLCCDLMLRASWLSLSKSANEKQGVLLFNMHHIASDDWSMGLLEKEFFTRYQAIKQNQSEPFSPLTLQYADYAVWQHEHFQGATLEKQLNYWKKQLEGIPQVHSLPLDYPRPEQQSFNGELLKTKFSTTLTNQIKNVCSDNGLTLYMFLQTAYALLLAQYSHSDEVVIGSPSAGRDDPELDQVIGCFVNNIVVRTPIDNRITFAELLQQNKNTILDAFENQAVPYDAIVAELKHQRSLAYSPVHQIRFVLQRQPEQQTSGATDELTLSSVSQQSVHIKFDLILMVNESTNNLEVNWLYNQDLFSQQSISQLAESYQSMLSSVCENLQQNICSVNYLTEQQKLRQIQKWGVGEKLISQPVRLAQHFEQQVERAGEKVAIIQNDKSWTYRALNNLANQIGSYLTSQLSDDQQQGLYAVGLLFDRSFEMVASILACLKAGVPYVPIDPANPQQRINGIIEDSAISLILTFKRLSQKLPQQQIKRLALDTPEFTNLIADLPIRNLTPETLQPSTAAYIIYTSGTSGQPKGVVATQANLSHFYHVFKQQLTYLSLTEDSPWLWNSSYAFDASIKGLVALTMGRALVLPTEESSKDPAALLKLVNQHQIEIINTPPLMMEFVLKQLQSSSRSLHLMVSGDQVSQSLWDKMADYCETHQTRGINAYGPTETTVNASFANIVAGKRVNIGRPCVNSSLFILNESGQLLPPGAIGELYIAGEGVTQGYLKSPQLTQQRYIDGAHFSQERLYKTGDLARFNLDGEVEFIGRCDSQVKIRGYRIEVDEIISRLKQLSSVDNATVLVDDEQHDNKKLVAYLAAGEPLDINAVRNEIAEWLPEYMIPADYHQLTEFPLTSGGKLDLTALIRQAEANRQSSQPKETENNPSESPRTATETIQSRLTKVWKALLKSSDIAAQDDFFKVGGHSLLAMRLMEEISREFNVELVIRDLFSHMTLQSQAELIESRLPDDIQHKPQQKLAGNCVIKLNESQTSNNLFCLHSRLGTSLVYRDMADQLSEVVNCYGLQPPQIYADLSFDSITELAAYYIQLIKSIQPEGKYYLLGYSLGGGLAYEIARQLTELGDVIGYLGIVDTAPQALEAADQNLPWYTPLQNVYQDYADFEFDWTQLDCFDESDGIIALASEITQRKISIDGLDHELLVQYLRYFCEIYRLRNNHQCESSSLNIALFKAKQELLAAETVALRSEFLDWDKFTQGEIRTHMVEGDHRFMLFPPNVDSLIKPLKEQLIKEIEK